MGEDYSDVTVKLSLDNVISRSFVTDKITAATIFECFDVSELLEEVEGMKHKVRKEKTITIEIYENINSISLLLKRGQIDLQQYLPDTITHDFCSLSASAHEVQSEQQRRRYSDSESEKEGSGGGGSDYFHNAINRSSMTAMSIADAKNSLTEDALQEKILHGM